MVVEGLVSQPGVMLLGIAWAVTAGEYLRGRGDRGYCAACPDQVRRFDLAVHSLFELMSVRHSRHWGGQ